MDNVIVCEDADKYRQLTVRMGRCEFWFYYLDRAVADLVYA